MNPHRLLLVAVVIFANTGCSRRAVYPPVNAPAGWLKYASTENGFMLHYPSDWSFTEQRQTVSLMSGDGIYFSISRFDLSVEQIRRENPHASHIPQHADSRHAMVADIPAEQFNHRSGNFDGTWRVESFMLPRGTVTYFISWLVHGRDQRSDDEKLCHNILATFRFTDPQHSDYLVYQDPLNRFSFEYPSKWLLTAGPTFEPAVTIHGDGDTWIGIYVYSREAAVHINLPAEDRVFEVGADRVRIHVFRSATPEALTRFLDHFVPGSR